QVTTYAKHFGRQHLFRVLKTDLRELSSQHSDQLKSPDSVVLLRRTVNQTLPAFATLTARPFHSHFLPAQSRYSRIIRRVDFGSREDMILRCGVANIVLIGAVFIAAPALSQEVSYYDVPQAAQPHDVAPAPDGSVWYTAQAQGALGRLDPATGAVKQIPLGEQSAPHGVIAGPDGAA